MWGGILFSPPAEAHALVAGFMSGTIRNPCFRRDDRAQSLVATLAERYKPAEQAWPSRRPRETAISGVLPRAGDEREVERSRWGRGHGNVEADRASRMGLYVKARLTASFFGGHERRGGALARPKDLRAASGNRTSDLRITSRKRVVHQVLAPRGRARGRVQASMIAQSTDRTDRDRAAGRRPGL